MPMLRHAALLLCFWLTLSLVGVRAAELPDFTELVERASPAVVNISTLRSAGEGMSMFEGHPQLEDMPELFRHFFGDRIPGVPQGPRGPRQAQSTGSGFIVSRDGYILTNNHVIADAEEIFVRLADRRELKATLVGSDEQSDMAVLKVEADDLPVVKMGSSSRLKVGEWVVAIGAPFGFDYSVTAGIVSAKGRSLPNENYVPFIQTDVAINPGNSGGPLFNLEGEVVGINSQIYTRSGGFMGLSFAIPIDVAMEVMQQLKTHGSVKRGWLGVLIQEVSKDLAESFQLDKPRGALVAQILPDSPAAGTELQVGDVIVAFNGTPIGFSAELPHLVGRTTPGTRVELEVVRQGKTRTVAITIGELPTEPQTVAKAGSGQSAPASTLNMELRDLTDAEREEAGVKQGVLVLRVDEGPAAEAGIREGDILSSLDNRAIESTRQLRDLIEELPRNKALPVLIIRGGSPVFVVIKLRD